MINVPRESANKCRVRRENRREVGLEFPEDGGVFSLNHAADSGRGTFDCQRAAGLPMIPRVLMFVQRPACHEPQSAAQRTSRDGGGGSEGRQGSLSFASFATYARNLPVQGPPMPQCAISNS
jgi:hypothetical protein